MLDPHPHNVPLVLVAITWALPHDIEVHVVSAPICTGDEYDVVLPVPNWPDEFSPIANRLPDEFSMTENVGPAAAVLYQVLSEPT